MGAWQDPTGEERREWNTAAAVFGEHVHGAESALTADIKTRWCVQSVTARRRLFMLREVVRRARLERSQAVFWFCGTAWPWPWASHSPIGAPETWVPWEITCNTKGTRPSRFTGSL